MKINHQIVVFDTANPATESNFWAGVLGGTVDDRHHDFHLVSVDGQPRIGVQLAPDHIPPQWPDGQPQQVHLDLWVDDIATAHARVMSLGATLLKEADDGDSGDAFQVYADPAGHPFCLCWVRKPR